MGGKEGERFWKNRSTHSRRYHEVNCREKKSNDYYLNAQGKGSEAVQKPVMTSASKSLPQEQAVPRSSHR